MEKMQKLKKLFRFIVRFIFINKLESIIRLSKLPGLIILNAVLPADESGTALKSKTPPTDLTS